MRSTNGWIFKHDALRKASLSLGWITYSRSNWPLMATVSAPYLRELPCRDFVCVVEQAITRLIRDITQAETIST